MTTGLQSAGLERRVLAQEAVPAPPEGAGFPFEGDGAQVMRFPRSVTWRRRLRELVRRPRARAAARTSRVAPPITPRGRARDVHDHAVLHGVIPPGF